MSFTQDGCIVTCTGDRHHTTSMHRVLQVAGHGKGGKLQLIKMLDPVTAATRSLEGQQSTNKPTTNWLIMWRSKYAKQATKEKEDNACDQFFPLRTR